MSPRALRVVALCAVLAGVWYLTRWAVPGRAAYPLRDALMSLRYDPGDAGGPLYGFRYRDLFAFEPQAPVWGDARWTWRHRPYHRGPRDGLEFRPASAAFSRLRPGFHKTVDGVRYRFNAEGMRGPEIARAKPAGTGRVALLGNSTAWGWAVAEEAALPARLDAALNAGRVCGRRWEVLNLGVPSLTTGALLAHARDRAAEFSPDVILLGINHRMFVNELEFLYNLHRPFDLPPLLDVGSLIGGIVPLRGTAFALEVAASARAAGIAPAPLFRRVSRDRFAADARALLTAQLRSLSVIARAAGARPRAAFLPLLRPDGDFEARLRAAAGEAARASGVPLRDLRPLVAADPESFRATPKDFLHPNARAAEAFAAVLAADIGADCPAPEAG